MTCSHGTVKTSGRVFQIFPAFSENLNFAILSVHHLGKKYQLHQQIPSLLYILSFVAFPANLLLPVLAEVW